MTPVEIIEICVVLLLPAFFIAIRNLVRRPAPPPPAKREDPISDWFTPSQNNRLKNRWMA